MAFSPGDVVQLKSGGPAMTVVVESQEGVRCIWHAEVAGEVRSAMIPAACLDEIELDDDIYEIEDLEQEDLEQEELEDDLVEDAAPHQPVLPLPPTRKKRNDR